LGKLLITQKSTSAAKPVTSSSQAIIFKFIILLLAVCLVIITCPTQALASVEGFVARCSDDLYHQYSYNNLLDSYALSLLGASDGLYEDFKSKEAVAVLDSAGGYLDYSNLLLAYARALLSGESFNLNSFAHNGTVVKISIPGSVQLVSVKSGQLVREKINPSQGGFEPDCNSGDSVQITPDQTESEKPLTITPIVGPHLVSLEQAIQWAQRNGAHQRFIDVAPFYWEYGAQSGIRPEVLYAQAALETGFGRFGGLVLPEYNNWAGIKTATASGDEPEDHEQFATPADGVRAHFNHMSAYLGLNPIGEPHARYHSVKNISWAGSVTLVEELSGKWAPSPTYHERIVTMITEMK
jgi:hypothetical protein